MVCGSSSSSCSRSPSDDDEVRPFGTDVEAGAGEVGGGEVGEDIGVLVVVLVLE